MGCHHPLTTMSTRRPCLFAGADGRIIRGPRTRNSHRSSPDRTHVEGKKDMTTPIIPLLPFNPPNYDMQPRQSMTVPRVTMTTAITVGCIITSCILIAVLVAAILKQKRSRMQRKGKDSPTKGDNPAGNTEKPLVDADIYSEIEPKGSSCCFCFCKTSTYSMSPNDTADNIYAEVQDVKPYPTPGPAKEVIYETLDGKEWSRSRQNSDTSREESKAAPFIYDHLSFQELERLNRENGDLDTEKKTLKKVDADQPSCGYDRLDRSPQNLSASDGLDNPDGNNNSLVRRLSQRQILKKLFAVDIEGIQRSRLSPTNSQASSNKDSASQPTGFVPAVGHEYFVLEDVCELRNDRRPKPPVPIRTCSLRSSLHGDRCVSIPRGRGHGGVDNGRRVRSFPERQGCFRSNETPDTISVVSSEAVYNISSGHALRFSSHSRPIEADVSLRSPRNDYFVLEPTFTNCSSSSRSFASQSDSQSDDRDNVSTASRHLPRNDYFVLESETEQTVSRGTTFRIVEGDASAGDVVRRPCSQTGHGAVQGQRDSYGVTVVRLLDSGNDDTSRDSEESLYDRLRFKSVSHKTKKEYRPRLLSTPNNIEF
ncbi:uncharacterized protein LOC124134650 isoform X1 [Haliotis rufescens]|uniref:uncharacterized protein LOC124134650 isoform X1 n=2 Tax=Haliotis rufescens TaxID=6454 RepID=UPI00201F7718|nr:uncharacterized protein LOC124134650 isoform X1 [Haliotis rufescens]